MSSQLLPAALTAAATGLLGISTGLTLSYNLILFPTIRTTHGLSGAQKLGAWKGGYDDGLRSIVPLPLLGAALFTTAAILMPKPGADVQRWLLTAAFFGAGHILLTILTILPTNNRLMALHVRPTLSSTEEKEVDGLLSHWLRLHTPRVLSVAASTVLGLTALVLM